MTAIRQGTEEWLDARRSLVTATDIPVLLGLSPYKCEADLADEKRGLWQQPTTLRMRAGSLLQDLIGEAYTEKTGRKVRRFGTLVIHPSLPWAGASPDFRTVGERRLVEAKRTASRSRFADGLPQDIEAQVQWQLGVTGYPSADVAALIADEDVQVFPVDFDADLFQDLVAVAEDFRRRLAEGGDFARDLNRVKRDYPRDDGSEMAADEEITEAVRALLNARAARKGYEELEAALETAIKTRMADAAVLHGNGFRITWKRTKDSEQTDWKSLSASLLRLVPESERQTLVGLHSSVREGFRPFRLTTED